ncbi:MAG: hypothetical protein R2849_10350 [Thermomicrobiales bacterium]
MSEDVGDSWIALLDHGLSITGTKPSKRWLSEAATLADDVGHSSFEALALEFLGLLDRPTRDIYYEAADGYDYPRPGLPTATPTSSRAYSGRSRACPAPG